MHAYASFLPAWIYSLVTWYSFVKNRKGTHGAMQLSSIYMEYAFKLSNILGLILVQEGLRIAFLKFIRMDKLIQIKIRLFVISKHTW